MSRATLLLGSNLGDRVDFLRQATTQISSLAGVLVRSTDVMRTEPWGYESGNYYLNQVVVVDTTLLPLDLLDVLQSIEVALGRERAPRAVAVDGQRYADRTIDIDILYYDALSLDHPRLTLPHPRIDERPFVMALLDALRANR